MTHSVRLIALVINMTTMEFAQIAMHRVRLVMEELTPIVCLAQEELF